MLKYGHLRISDLCLYLKLSKRFLKWIGAISLEKHGNNRINEAIGYLLINVAWQVKEALRREFVGQGFDLTSDQFAVLMRLWEEDGLTQSELSEKTCKNKSNLTRILDSMEKKGFVIRQKNPKDRRSFCIELTDSGRNLEEKLIPIAVKTHESLFGNFSEAEESQLRRILEKIEYNLSEGKAIG